MRDYDQKLSSQLKITIEDGLIVPITAVVSESDSQNEDPFFSIPCYTENPDVPIILKIRKSKMAGAYPTNDFFHPTKVEGLSIVAHGLVSLDNSVDIVQIQPLIVTVIDLTVKPTPVNIPERIQSLLNIKEGQVLTDNRENIKSVQVEVSNISETITCETMQNKSTEILKGYAETIHLENSQNSSTSLRYNDTEDLMNQLNQDISSTDKTDSKIDKTKETENAYLNKISLNDILPSQNEENPDPLAYDQDMIDYSVNDYESYSDNNVSVSDANERLCTANMEAENVRFNKSLCIQPEDDESSTQLPHSIENANKNYLDYNFEETKESHSIMEDPHSEVETVIASTETNKTLVIDETTSNENAAARINDGTPPPLNINKLAFLPNIIPDVCDNTQAAVNIVGNVQRQLKRKKAKRQNEKPTELRRSPRLAKKKRVQYFPPTRRINRRRKLLMLN